MTIGLHLLEGLGTAPQSLQYCPFKWNPIPLFLLQNIILEEILSTGARVEFGEFIAKDFAAFAEAGRKSIIEKQKSMPAFWWLIQSVVVKGKAGSAFLKFYFATIAFKWVPG